MGLISRDQLVKEYYQTIKDKYPHLSPEQVKQICFLPFDGVYEWLKKGLYPRIFIGYLGKIIPNERKVMNRIAKLEAAYLKRKPDSILTDELYQQKKKEYEELLEGCKKFSNRSFQRFIIKHDNRTDIDPVNIIDDL